MTEVCKQILEEMDDDQFNRLAWETGIDILDFLTVYDVNNEDSKTILGHFLQCTTQFLRATENGKMRRLCRRLVIALTEIGDPEDVILFLTEQIEFEEETDNKEVTVLIECMKISVNRLPGTDYRPITWCLNSIIRYLNCGLPLPKEHNLEGEEKLLLDADANVVLLESLYARIMDLIESVIDDVVPKLTITHLEKIDFKDAIVLFLLKLLGEPLAFMDLEIHGKENAKNAFRFYSETVIKRIYELNCNVLRFLDCVDGSMATVVDDDYSHISVGTFYYLIFHEGLHLNKLPQVYSPLYIFKCVLELASVMFEYSSNLVRRKALLLCMSCLERIQENSLKKSEIDITILSKFSEALPNIMVYAEFKENRLLAVKIFRKFIFCLDSVGRYTVLLNIPKLSANSGFVGYATTIVKDIINCYLSTENNRDSQYFSGKLLSDILKNLTKLPQGVETDIAEKADTIISTLNFLRYLTLKDKQNVTGIWDSVHWIKQDFLIPLKEAIEISKAHYELEISNTDKGNPQIPFSISVEENILPNLSTNDKKNILLNAINTFDLIDSLRVRVIECIELQQSTTTQK